MEGEGGLLAQLTELVLESALEGEVTAHLGYEKDERTNGSADGNARNGTRSNTVLTKAGPVEIDVLRDRADTFEPMVVRRRQRRLGSIEDVVLSLSARGMTHGDIFAHLAEVYGQEVSKETISTIMDKVLDGMAEWQNRPLDPIYPVVFIDCIHVKIRDGQAANRPFYIALAVTVDDNRGILGLWAAKAGRVRSTGCRCNADGRIMLQKRFQHTRVSAEGLEALCHSTQARGTVRIAIEPGTSRWERRSS